MSVDCPFNAVHEAKKKKRRLSSYFLIKFNKYLIIGLIFFYSVLSTQSQQTHNNSNPFFCSKLSNSQEFIFLSISRLGEHLKFNINTWFMVYLNSINISHFWLHLDWSWRLFCVVFSVGCGGLGYASENCVCVTYVFRAVKVELCRSHLRVSEKHSPLDRIFCLFLFYLFVQGSW